MSHKMTILKFFLSLPVNISVFNRASACHFSPYTSSLDTCSIPHTSSPDKCTSAVFLTGRLHLYRCLGYWCGEQHQGRVPETGFLHISIPYTSLIDTGPPKIGITDINLSNISLTDTSVIDNRSLTPESAQNQPPSMKHVFLTTVPLTLVPMILHKSPDKSPSNICTP